MRLIPFLFLFVSCSTTYLYSGRAKVKDTMGKEREALIYWTSTKSLFRKGEDDTGGAAVKVKLQCSSITLNYEEREDGIYLLKDSGNFKKVVTEGNENVCGEVRGWVKINNMREGELSLTNYCNPKAKRRSFKAARRTIAASPEPVKFMIKKQKVEPPIAPPDVIACVE